MRARYYAPDTGRFLTKDVWTGVANKPPTYNKWLYANANPVMFTDPSGYCSGNPGDPNNPDKNCWRMLLHLETKYSNIDIFNQDVWTYNELVAVAEALGGHVFGADILSANSIRFYREDFGQPGVGGAVTELGNGTYNLTMYDFAYNMPPHMNETGSPASMFNFEGTLIHELAHVATLQNLSILESYKQESSKHFPFSTIGAAYGWQVCRGQPNCEEIERIAIAAAVWQKDPNSFRALFYTDWRKSWIQTQYSPNPLVDMCYGYQ